MIGMKSSSIAGGDSSNKSPRNGVTFASRETLESAIKLKNSRKKWGR